MLYVQLTYIGNLDNLRFDLSLEILIAVPIPIDDINILCYALSQNQLKCFANILSNQHHSC